MAISYVEERIKNMCDSRSDKLDKFLLLRALTMNIWNLNLFKAFDICEISKDWHDIKKK